MAKGLHVLLEAAGDGELLPIKTADEASATAGFSPKEDAAAVAYEGIDEWLPSEEEVLAISHDDDNDDS